MINFFVRGKKLANESDKFMASNSILIGFIFSLVVFILIGLLSGVNRKSSTEDYLLANQDIKP